MRHDPFADVKLIAMLVVTLIVATLGYRFLMTPQVDTACVFAHLAGGTDHLCTRLYRWFGL